MRNEMESYCVGIGSVVVVFKVLFYDLMTFIDIIRFAIFVFQRKQLLHTFIRKVHEFLNFFTIDQIIIEHRKTGKLYVKPQVHTLLNIAQSVE